MVRWNRPGQRAPAALLALLGALLACALPTGSSDEPGVVHFPEVQSADWVASVSTLCIVVEQSYTGLSGHTEAIGEELQAIFERIGVTAISGEDGDCEATLTITLTIKPIAKDYAGAISDCYTSAEASGRATLAAPGHLKLVMDLSHTIHGAQIISECPTSPDEAPLEAAWAGAVMPVLRDWWGSPALVSALQSESYRLRSQATNQLVQMGPEGAAALPVLIEMLGAADPSTRAAAAQTLGSFGPAAAEAVPALIEALEDTNPNVRYSAVTALGEIGGSEVVEPLAACLHSSDSYERSVAAEALADVGREAAPAVPDLIGVIHDDFKQVGWFAVEALGAIGPEAEEAVPVLIELLEADDWTYHSDAALALTSITGEDFGEDGAAWRRWYESQQR